MDTAPSGSSRAKKRPRAIQAAVTPIVNLDTDTEPEPAETRQTATKRGGRNAGTAR
jgi:hypothetical protein